LECPSEENIKKIIALFSKLISKVHMPFNHKKMTEAECIAIIGMIKPGDILLTHTRGELSNIALDHWGHGAIYSLSGLWEAVTAGVKPTELMFFLSRKDDVLVLRPRFGVDTSRLDRYCKYAEGTAYDYSFETGAEKIYCFEYCADAIMESSSAKIETKRTPLGKQYLASSFLENDFDVVWKKRK
jgi:uncharacterized protein YycO